MRIVVNGEPRTVPEAASLAVVLAGLNLHPRRVAVEAQQVAGPPHQFDATVLAKGDALEIVTLVGGG